MHRLRDRVVARPAVAVPVVLTLGAKVMVALAVLQAGRSGETARAVVAVAVPRVVPLVHPARAVKAVYLVAVASIMTPASASAVALAKRVLQVRKATARRKAAVAAVKEKPVDPVPRKVVVMVKAAVLAAAPITVNSTRDSMPMLPKSTSPR